MSFHPRLLKRATLLTIGTLLYGACITGALADAFQLGLPVRCEMGKACFIQNYVDHQEGSTYQDYRCGHLTYDKHPGTDFRVIDDKAMAEGVAVLAAAPGRVLGVRDGEPDIAVSTLGQNKVTGKEAGNGVVLDHGNGWQTQYSHLRKGSVQVKKGEWVEQGQPIGLIGESGLADFPHVDFSVRKDGKPVDPFWPRDSWSCHDKNAPPSLWRPEAQKQLAYTDTAILHVGFANKIPTRLEAQTGQWSSSQLPNHSAQLVMWADIMGANGGDQWRIQITAPTGELLINATGEVDRDKAVIVIGAGKILRSGLWPSGNYRGVFTLTRAGATLLTRSETLKITP